MKRLNIPQFCVLVLERKQAPIHSLVMGISVTDFSSDAGKEIERKWVGRVLICRQNMSSREY